MSWYDYLGLLDFTKLLWSEGLGPQRRDPAVGFAAERSSERGHARARKETTTSEQAGARTLRSFSTPPAVVLCSRSTVPRLGRRIAPCFKGLLRSI